MGGLVPFWLEEYLEPYIEYMELHVAHPSFSYVPLVVSLVVALGGLAVGFFIYRGFKVGQIDPMRRCWVRSGRCSTTSIISTSSTMRRLSPSHSGLSKFLYWVDDLWVIDPIVNAIGRLNVWWSSVLAAFDQWVIDGTVNGAGWISDRSGRVLRNIQDGHVQVYLLVAVVALTIWLLLEALPILLTLV